jgi:hypothetical protein
MYSCIDYKLIGETVLAAPDREIVVTPTRTENQEKGMSADARNAKA